MNSYNYCPRCGLPAMEHLATHSYCWECGYSPEPKAKNYQWRKIQYSKACSKHSFGKLNPGQVVTTPDPRA